MKRFASLALLVAVAVTMTGCGQQLQRYHQGLEAQSRLFQRQQAILDEQNQILINDLKSKQKAQLIQQAKAEGEMEVARAAGEAQAEIERAKGDAQANRLRASTITPLLVQYQFVSHLNDKSVIYLPNNVLPLMKLSTQ